jgi:hypothetical protein
LRFLHKCSFAHRKLQLVPVLVSTEPSAGCVVPNSWNTEKEENREEWRIDALKKAIREFSDESLHSLVQFELGTVPLPKFLAPF